VKLVGRSKIIDVHRAPAGLERCEYLVLEARPTVVSGNGFRKCHSATLDSPEVVEIASW